jgi:hypothetical protein
MESKQTAMRQLLNQLREERNALPMDVEWNRCFQAIESVIESKYIPMEKEQIEQAFRDGWFDGNNPLIFKIENEQYYKEKYESKTNI